MTPCSQALPPGAAWVVLVVCAQVLFSVMQNFRPEIPPEEQLPGKPGVTLPRCAQSAAAGR